MADAPQPSDLAENSIAPASTALSPEELGYGPAEVQKFLTKWSATNKKRGATVYDDTLVRLLSHWLRDHHERLLAYRKKTNNDSKKRQSTQSGEQSNPENEFQFLVDWILQNIASANVAPQPQDIESLCETLCAICQKTYSEEDFKSVILILHQTAQLWPYPEPLLAMTVKLFCQLHVYYRTTQPEKLLDFMKILVHSKNQQVVLEHLYTFATVIDNTSDNAGLLNIRVARGALAVIRHLLHEKNEKDEFLLQFNRVVDAMRTCAKLRAIKLCTAILPLSGALLTEDGRVRDSLRFKWSDLMKCIKTAAKSFAPEASQDKSGEQPPTFAASNSEIESARDIALHTETVEQLNLDLAGLMNSKPEITLMQMIYDYLIFYPKALTENVSISVLQYIDDAGLCRPDARAWRWEIDRILDLFVQPPRSSPEVRKHAIKVLGNFFEQVGINPEGGYPAEETRLRAYYTMRTILVDLLSKTGHAEVVDSLLIVFAKARMNFAEWNDIIQSLAELLQQASATDPASLALSRSAATSLLSFIAPAANKNPVATNVAFQAIISMVSDKDLPVQARLSMLRFLFSIRCDLMGTICVIENLESEEIAAALDRTVRSLELLSLEPRSARDGLSTAVAAGSSQQKSSLWLYPDFEQLMTFQSTNKSMLYARDHELPNECSMLDTGSWLVKIIELLLRADTDWEIYSFIIVHLGAQLGNVELFRGSLPAIIKLRQVLCEQVREGRLQEPPIQSGLRKSDVAICMFDVLTNLIPYATLDDENIEKAFADDLIKAFLCGVGGAVYDGTAKSCIHALSLCAFETPKSVASQYPTIIDKMQKSMTQSYLATDILEFLSQVARLPKVHEKFRDEEITTVFGMCIRYLEQSREQLSKPSTPAPPSLGNLHRNSSPNVRRSHYKQMMMQNVGFPQGIAAMAYHTMIYLFLALKLEVRGKFVSWIVPRLIGRGQEQQESATEQSTVFIDMMQRAAYSDLGETRPDPAYITESWISRDSWVYGLSIVTIEVKGYDGTSQITKRQASGTTYASYRQGTAQLPPHHVPVETNMLHGDDDPDQNLPASCLPTDAWYCSARTYYGSAHTST